MNTSDLGALDQLFAAANDHLSEATLAVGDLLKESSPELVWRGFVNEFLGRFQSDDCDFRTVAAVHAAALIRLAGQS